jgi:hypothetical protein
MTERVFVLVGKIVLLGHVFVLLLKRIAAGHVRMCRRTKATVVPVEMFVGQVRRVVRANVSISLPIARIVRHVARHAKPMKHVSKVLVSCFAMHQRRCVVRPVSICRRTITIVVLVVTNVREI